MIKDYELNPKKIALRALQIQEKVFYNGGKSMYQFSFEEKDREDMTKKVEEEKTNEDSSNNP